VLPLMMVRYLGPGLLGLGITALIAGFMSGMAGNVSAFSAVWTYDIYQPHINKKARRALCSCRPLGDHPRRGHLHRRSLPGDERAGIMDYVQALFSFFISPLLGVVLWACSGSAPPRRAASGAC
jgi:solute:Na+ symporter, SSS family